MFFPDGKKLASASGDQTIRLWDVASRTCLDVLRGHHLEVWRLALLPDEKTLVSGCKDGTVCFWDTSTTHPRRDSIALPEKVTAWRFSPDSQSVLALNEQGQLSHFSGSDFHQRETILETGTGGHGSLISQDGRFLAIGSADGTLRVWDLPRRLLSHQFNTGAAQAAYSLNFLAGGSKLLTGPDGYSAGSIHEWDLTTGVETQAWQVPKYSVADVSSDERYCLAVGNGDNLVRNLADKSNTIFHQDSLEESEVCYSPDGKLVALIQRPGVRAYF
jgi:WD40 repeat protein